jgi:prevent-host-death family protein
MKQVGVRALKQNASAVVAEVVAGDSLTITDRGRPVARIVPIKQSTLDSLIEVGLARPALASRALLDKPLKRRPGEVGLSEVLLQNRREERY